MLPTSNTTKKRILWLSDSPTCNSGFGVVAKNLIDNICAIMGDAIQIDVIAINLYSDTPIPYNKQTTLFDGKQDGDTYDPYCRSFFMNVLDNTDQPYDAIFILQDFPVVVNMIPILRKIKSGFTKINKPSFKSFLYVPVDGYVHEWTAGGFTFFDFLATYTEYGKKQIAKAAPQLLKQIKVIPHGCNTKDFYPLPTEEIAQFRKEYFGEGFENKIIFTNVNRNQPRKGIVDTILSFQEAKKIWDIKDYKPFLYLHMNRNDDMGYNLDHVLNQLDLVEGEDYKFAPKEYFTGQYGVSTEMLNQIYNASDVFITTTLGEGWGLSVTEAMAVRVPVICPNHTSLTYISGNGKRANLLNNLYPNCNNNDNIIREQVEIQETAELMISTAKSVISGNTKTMLDEAQAFVKGLNWKDIAGQFVKSFNEII